MHRWWKDGKWRGEHKVTIWGVWVLQSATKPKGKKGKEDSKTTAVKLLFRWRQRGWSSVFLSLFNRVWAPFSNSSHPTPPCCVLPGPTWGGGRKVSTHVPTHSTERHLHTLVWTLNSLDGLCWAQTQKKKKEKKPGRPYSYPPNKLCYYKPFPLLVLVACALYTVFLPPALLPPSSTPFTFPLILLSLSLSSAVCNFSIIKFHMQGNGAVRGIREKVPRSSLSAFFPFSDFTFTFFQARPRREGKRKVETYSIVTWSISGFCTFSLIPPALFVHHTEDSHAVVCIVADDAKKTRGKCGKGEKRRGALLSSFYFQSGPGVH